MIPKLQKRELHDRWKAISAPQRVVVVGGGMLAAMGLATAVWGGYIEEGPQDRQYADQMGCSLSQSVSCDQLVNDNLVEAAGKDLFEDGVFLLTVGSATAWLTLRRGKKSDNPSPATSIELPESFVGIDNLEQEFENLLEGKTPAAKDIPND